MVATVATSVDVSSGALGGGFVLIGIIKVVQYLYYIYLYFSFESFPVLEIVPIERDGKFFSGGCRIYPSVLSVFSGYSTEYKRVNTVLKYRSSVGEGVEVRVSGNSYIVEKGGVKLAPVAYSLFIFIGLYFLL